MARANDPQLERERAVYTYLDALESGDIDAIIDVLNKAVYDAPLDQMIVEAHQAFFQEEANRQSDLVEEEVEVLALSPLKPARKKDARQARRASVWMRTLAAVLLVGVLVGSFVAVLEGRKSGQWGGQSTTPSATSTTIGTPPGTPPPSLTPVPQLVNGSSAYLVDATSGEVLLDFNSHLRVPMWSTTKIMTALLTIEHLPMDHIVTIQQAELDEVPSGVSVAQLRANDRMSVQDLLYGLMLPSGSDAAIVLAHEVSGSTASFVALMNTRASQLGLNDTHFTNPYGADDPTHYSSAADLVKLARVVMRYTTFAQIVSAQTYHLNPNFAHARYDWQNLLNPFLRGYQGANGIKTGSNGDGTIWCMVFSATRHGHLLIGAEMQASSEKQVFNDAENILDKGFSS